MTHASPKIHISSAAFLAKASALVTDIHLHLAYICPAFQLSNGCASCRSVTHAMHDHNRGIRKKRTKTGSDILSRLPPELAVAILEHLNGVELMRIPNVCQTWRSFFARDSLYGPHFRAIIRDCFGKHIPTEDPGRVYLALRSETCHLCPTPRVFPFVHVSSNALAIMKGDNEPVTLFPVCKTCAITELDKNEFDVVVEEAHVSLVCPGISEKVMREAPNGSLRCQGYMYSDVSRFKGNSAPLLCVRVSLLRNRCRTSVFEGKLR